MAASPPQEPTFAQVRWVCRGAVGIANSRAELRHDGRRRRLPPTCAPGPPTPRLPPPPPSAALRAQPEPQRGRALHPARPQLLAVQRGDPLCDRAQRRRQVAPPPRPRLPRCVFVWLLLGVASPVGWCTACLPDWYRADRCWRRIPVASPPAAHSATAPHSADPFDAGALTLAGRAPEEWGLPRWRSLVAYVHQSRVQHRGTPAELYFALQQFKAQVRGVAVHALGREGAVQAMQAMLGCLPRIKLSCPRPDACDDVPLCQQRGRARGDLPALVHQLGLEQGVLNQPWVELSVSCPPCPSCLLHACRCAFCLLLAALSCLHVCARTLNPHPVS